MRKFFKVIIGLLFIPVFILFLLLTTINLRFLDPEFVSETLRNSNTYEKIEFLVKRELRKRFGELLEERGEEFTRMPSYQQEAVLEMFEEAVSAVSEDEVQDLVETNIDRFWGYIKGESPTLYLYLPVDQLGFPDELIGGSPLAELSDETSLDVLVETQEELQEQNRYLSEIQNVVSTIKVVWFISIIVMIVLLLVHLALSKKPGKIQSTFRLLVYTGAVILALSGGAFYLASESIARVEQLDEIAKLIVGAIIPQLVMGVVGLWLMVGGGLIVIGIVFTVISLAFSRKKTSRAMGA